MKPMRRRLSVYALLPLLVFVTVGCDEDKASEVNQELVQCFGESVPSVSTTGNGRGFTQDEIQMAVYGPPAGSVRAEGEPDPQLVAALDAFAGITRTQYDQLEGSAEALEDIFDEAENALDELIGYSFYEPRLTENCQIIDRASSSKLVSTSNCNGVGTVTFEGPATLLDAIEKGLHGKDPQLSSALRDTLTITLDVSTPSGDYDWSTDQYIEHVVTFKAKVKVLFELDEFVVSINEAANSGSVKLVGGIDVLVESFEVERRTAELNTLVASGSIAGGVKAEFDVDGSVANQQTGTGDSYSDKTEVVLRSGLVKLTADDINASSGNLNIALSGDVFVDASGTMLDEYIGDNREHNESYEVAGDVGFEAFRFQAKALGHAVEAEASGKASGSWVFTDRRAGRHGVDGRTSSEEGKGEASLSCLTTSVTVTPSGGSVSDLEMTLFGKATGLISDEYFSNYFSDPYRSEYRGKGKDELVLNGVVARVNLLGKQATGGIGRFVATDQSTYADEWNDGVGYSSTSTSESKDSMVLENAGYKSFAGYTYVLRTAPEYALESTHTYTYDGESSSTREYLPSGRFEMVSKDVLSEERVQFEEEGRVKLKTVYKLNDETVPKPNP